MGGDSRARRISIFRALAGNGALVRVVVAYALFIVTEYSVWLAMLVYAYQHGGATVAALVAIAQLVPAALLAPFAAAVADRWSPVVLLAGGYLGQAVGMAATAAAVVTGAPLAAYAAAAFASALVTTTRPAQATLIPSIAVTADQLTAANVVLGWVEAVSVAASGLLAGVLIAAGGWQWCLRCALAWAWRPWCWSPGCGRQRSGRPQSVPRRCWPTCATACG